ncbi:helix-turn-helix transcriptional regulator [Sedimentitalea todarodis]|uniref:Helix-turn-helix transcriptional regulator n=1 Tax=Sedimentitalea todarodis TaxID=1631240 RepID=A0ABU3VLC2_9RHOB|nr:helix-turn-helix transcriptional regulator [Sedimentitalea todarodis]MDU9006978.1 helix-turn-helix transcriptional regulator [Sedimentitalea todarodis]
MQYDEEALQLIPRIYDAAIDPAKWPEVLLQLASSVGARGAIVLELDELANHAALRMSYCSSNYDLKTIGYYLEHHLDEEMADQAVFARHSQACDEIELISDDVLAPSRQALLERGNVQTLAKFDIAHRSAALLNKDLPSIDRFAFQFSETHGPLGEDGRTKSRILLPHLAKALHVARPTRELAGLNTLLLESLNGLAIGMCLIDRERRILVKNLEFDRQLEEYDVFELDRRGCIRLRNDRAMQAASTMLSSFHHHGHHGARPRKEAITVQPKSHTHNLCIDVCPVENIDGSVSQRNGASIIYSLDTAIPVTIDSQKLTDLYQLTKTESSMLLHLCEGLTNPQISQRVGKSVHTVNTQIKSLLSKTATANRTQLLRLAWQSGSFLLPEIHPNG